MQEIFQGPKGTDVMERMKILRLIENMTLGAAAVGYRTESMHGAGSPQAQRIMISRQSGLDEKRDWQKAGRDKYMILIRFNLIHISVCPSIVRPSLLCYN